MVTNNLTNMPSAEPQEQKADAGKPDWTLFPFECALPILEVLEYGVRKYGTREGWKTVLNGERRYLRALARHTIALARGQEIDPESGLSHLGHIGCNVLFLAWFANERLKRIVT